MSTPGRHDGDPDGVTPEAPPRLWPLVVGAILTGVAIGLAVAIGLSLRAPSPSWSPSARADPVYLASVDWATVHAELWPAWVVASATEEGEPEAFLALREAVLHDPNLAGLLEEMRALAREDAARHARRLLALAEGYNAYLDAAALPWRISAGIQVRDDASVLYLKTYEVLVDTQAQVADERFRTRVLARADDTNIVEGYLGTTSDHQEGALVVLDRIVAFSLDRVWPLLDPELDPSFQVRDQPFAAPIRRAVAAALPADAAAVLRDTARSRFLLNRAVDGVHDRHACGARFVVGRIPHDGIGPKDIQVLRRFAAATGTAPCPDVTPDEAQLFAVHSRELRDTEGLRDAVERLVAWTARAIALHEVRHAADDRAHGQLTPLPCRGCPEQTASERLELSAYLESFADPVSGQVALYQACGVPASEAADRADAVRWASSQLADACDAPPHDLAPRARSLRDTLFGTAPPVTLPDFPLRLRVGGARREIRVDDRGEGR